MDTLFQNIRVGIRSRHEICGVWSLLANHLLVALLYEVSPTDGVTLVVTAVLLLGVAGLASVIPAQFSTRVDPVSALRAE